jgi:hypothetical protein
MTAFWDTAPYCLHHQADYLDGGGSKHLWNVGMLNETTRRCTPKRYHVHTRRRDNVKPQITQVVDSLKGFW